MQNCRKRKYYIDKKDIKNPHGMYETNCIHMLYAHV